MNNVGTASEISEVIRMRRTIKPEKMNGRVIPEDVLSELLNSADWAPTHARTEPWRFIVVDNPRVKEFARWHADLLRANSDPATFTQLKYDNIARLGENVSHIIIAWMKRVPTHKIPEIEEVCASAAAIQNLLLTATANGVASFWSSSGLTHHPAFRDALNLGEEDRVLGILYLGYTDEPFKQGTRMVPLADKVEWRR
jgi:nitroreductase